MAIHDAIALANLLYAMPTKTSSDITKIFEEYQEERYPAVMDSFRNSQLSGKVTGRGIVGALALFFVTRMPIWLWRLAVHPFIFYFLSVFDDSCRVVEAI